MPGPLSNLRHEKFALELASGAPLLDSYLAAGYRPGYSARFNASRLRNTPKLRQRVEELQAEAAKDSIVSIQWVVQKLINIITGREPSKVRTDADGKRSEEIDHLAAAIALGKILGVGGDSVTVNAIANASAGAGTVDVDSMSDIDLARRLAFCLARGAPQEEFASSPPPDFSSDNPVSGQQFARDVERDDNPRVVAHGQLNAVDAAAQLTRDLLDDGKADFVERGGLRFAK